MQVIREDNVIFLVVQKGEEIMSTVENYCKENGIFSGLVGGIGALKNPTMGYFDEEKNEYLKQYFEGEYEIISLLGNISKKEGEPFFHGHLAIAGKDFMVRGGHLFDAEVSLTCEIVIVPGDSEIIRDDASLPGLLLWKLKRGKNEKSH